MARASKALARFHARKIYFVALTVATRRESVFVLCQVYWCYTDQPYCIYLREGFIDKLIDWRSKFRCGEFCESNIRGQDTHYVELNRCAVGDAVRCFLVPRGFSFRL